MCGSTEVGIQGKGDISADVSHDDACRPCQAAHLDGKRDEVALHAWRDVEAAGGGVHGRGVLAVLDLLEQYLLLVKPV
jgi:hypothetical protein